MELDPGLVFRILSHIRQHEGRREPGLRYQDIPGAYTDAQVDHHLKRCLAQGLITARDPVSGGWAVLSLTQKGWDYLRDEET